MTKEATKNLWKSCFNDSDDFVDLYFNLRYTNEVNMTLNSGQEIISALQMLPYPMTFCGEVISTAYVSGACTHPDYRGNGVMSELLSQAFARMFRNKSWISTLIPAEPWLFDYYARMGYATVFHHSIKKDFVFLDEPMSGINIRQTLEYEKDIYHYLNEKMAERPCCIQHTANDFSVICAELKRTNMPIYVATQEDLIVGIALISQEKKNVMVQELFSNSEKISNTLLYHIKQQTEAEQLQLIIPTTNQHPTFAIGMARIIDAKSILKLYAAAHPEQELNLELTDDQIASNNGHYYLNRGKCMYSKERLPGTHVSLSIAQLSEQILSPLHPYMSLMLN